MIRRRPRFPLAALGLFLAAPLASGQTKYPPRAEKLDIEIRYRIRTDRDERARQFRVLEAHLKRLGFVPAEREDEDLDIQDPTAERFTGTIPSKDVYKVLDDSRVRTILFAPAGFKYPDADDAPVPIRVGIPGGLLFADQQALHRQTVAQLNQLGFREAVGYDHVRYSIIRGDIPNANVFRLLKDLRREPAGWFLPETTVDLLPAPFRDLLPVRWVEVLAESDLTPAAPVAVPPGRVRLSQDLRAVLDDPMRKDLPLRVEVVTQGAPDERGLDLLRTRLTDAYGEIVDDPVSRTRINVPATIEGVVGHILTVRFNRANAVERYVNEPGVVMIRLPRPANETVHAPGPMPTPPATVLAAARLDQLHKAGYRGQGTKIVVIASGFPGLGEAVGKDLPPLTRFVDLTAELNPELLPAAEFASRVGSGTAAARAAHLAAPGADLVLVRVDPAALFQVMTVARFVRGDTHFSEAMQARVTELALRTADFQRRYQEAATEYRIAFQNLSGEDRPRTRRERAAAAIEALVKEEKEIATRVGRSRALQQVMLSLSGAKVVVNTLTWESGYPLDGLSELSRMIDQTFAGDATPLPASRSATRPRIPPRPVWVQAASDLNGSVWAGPYADVDRNGVMEFAPPAVPLPAGSWTRELNFLASRGPDGKEAQTLPANTRVRLVVQWREPHDPTTYVARDAQFPLTMRVFRQLDPAGEKRASDELAEVARSDAAPYRVAKEPGYGVYEQMVEFVVPEDGRYAVWVEGRLAFDPILPALRQQGRELTPRLVAEFVDATSDRGRPVFESFSTQAAGVGLPADAKSAVTVGDFSGSGLYGGGPGLRLLPKPDLSANGSAAVGGAGPGVAAGLVGGMVADAVGAGADPSDLLRTFGLKPGDPLIVPESWLRLIRPRTQAGGP